MVARPTHDGRQKPGPLGWTRSLDGSNFTGTVGAKARKARKETERRIRAERLSAEEQQFLRANARYEGSPLHKRAPGDFGLSPPASPRPDKTLCDDAGIFARANASDLLSLAIDRGLVSEGMAAKRFPKQMWVVDGGRVFEAMYGGSQTGCYHGYPVRRSDPLFDHIVALWNAA